MKTKAKILIIITLVSVIGYLGFSIGKKLNHKKEVAERIQSIPDFKFKELNGYEFTERDLNTLQPKLFVYFNSDCDFCQAEAQQIQKHLKALKKVQILFISFEEAKGIKDFAKKHHLLNQENITFLEDYQSNFSEIFDANTIPFMLLYSKDHQLIKKFKGATKIEKIIALLPSSKSN